MKWQLSPSVDLHSDRLSVAEADRQQVTAAEILHRFSDQPGIVLADEVGMGKTFVALAVAASVIDQSDGEDQVVVMVPPAVREKWPKEWRVFVETCWNGTELRATEETVSRGSEFLKLLDDPPDRRKHVIFLTHAALTSALTDPWVQLAIVRAAFLRQRWLADQRQVFPRWAGELFRNKSFTLDAVDRLLDSPLQMWRGAWKNAGQGLLPDDPVPTSIAAALPEVDLTRLRDALAEIPLRDSAYRKQRLSVVRKEMDAALREVWGECLRKLDLRLPLLILDEAHHLKNAHTRLAELFSPEARTAVDKSVGSGALSGMFDRMLFLTATPLQLGHSELVEVLRRFRGTRITDDARASFDEELAVTSRCLDGAQSAAMHLDRTWGRLTTDDLAGLPDDWWRGSFPDAMDHVKEVLAAVGACRTAMSAAQNAISPRVIRHTKQSDHQRRVYRPGAGILLDSVAAGEPGGLPVRGAATLPFLLAARAQALVGLNGLKNHLAASAYFADGLASSFEAYAETRRSTGAAVRDDSDPAELSATKQPLPADVTWYLNRITEALPDANYESWAEHPKINASVSRAIDLWTRGEKSVIFCFYVATGRALRSHISRALQATIADLAAAADPALKKLTTDEVFERLEARGETILRRGSGAATVVDEVVRSYCPTKLAEEDQAAVVDVVTRFLRTPAFLTRYVDLSLQAPEAMRRAFDKPDGSGLTLGDRVEDFVDELSQLVQGERDDLLAALREIPTGKLKAAFDPSEFANGPNEEGNAREAILPNVRLANGGVKRETRQRLMLAFNTPFLPEILIASSVMAEGVDLQHDCRHVIHHDLDWNPSVLEQRTGRLDRIRSKSARSKQPIVVYEPYLAGTQDERMFRVVKDREQWFNVVMGDRVDPSERASAKLAERVPLPPELAQELAMKLAVYRG